MLPQDTTHLIQRPGYQRGSPCQDPAGNGTTQRPADDRKLQWYGHVSSSSGLAKTILQGTVKGEKKKTRQTEEVVGRQHQGMDRPGVRQVPEGSEKQRNGGNWLPQRPNK